MSTQPLQVFRRGVSCWRLDCHVDRIAEIKVILGGEQLLGIRRQVHRQILARMGDKPNGHGANTGLASEAVPTLLETPPKRAPSAQQRLADPDWMRREYIEREQTVLEIAATLHVAHSTAYLWLVRHGIETQPLRARTRRRRSTSAKARPPITDQQRQKRSASQRARRERERLERLKRQGVPTHLCVICKRTLPRTDFPPLVTRRFQGTKCLACLREGVKGPVPCSIPDCARPAVTRGWCARHYQRWRQTGDPLHGSPVKPKPRGPGRPPAQPRPQIRMTSLADEPPAKLRRLLRAARDINIEFSEAWEASVPIATEGVAMAPMWDTVLSETRGAWESAYDRTGQPPALSRLTRDLA